MRPPSDNTTLTAVIDEFRDAGFAADFEPLPGARICCHECGVEVRAAKFSYERLRRLEGASDPDDMLAVLATRCPGCCAKGTLVLGYGPMASSDDADVATAVNDGRETSPHGAN